ncbi:MAG: AgmX/PglI C-terminal domain-containing protein [Myxococcota bacterium]
MYCQACGAENSEDARFCNQCGATIARPGEAGGPIAATQVGVPAGDAGSTVRDAAKPLSPGVAGAGQMGPDPFGGPSMMGVSLAGVGIQSSKKAWGTVLGIALALLAMGAFAGYLMGGGSGEEPVAEAGHAQAEDPMVIGAPELPTGIAPPSGEDLAAAANGGGSSRTTATMSATAGRTSTSSGSMTSSMTASMTASMSASMTTAMTGSGSTGSMTSSMSGSAGSGSTDAPEDRGIEMELYSGRVRYTIQRYYQARAQTCFDRATRNAPTLSGTVVIGLTIQADGSVTNTRVARNTTGDDLLGRCLASNVGTWQLPHPPGGSLQLTLPFSR